MGNLLIERLRVVEHLMHAGDMGADVLQCGIVYWGHLWDVSRVIRVHGMFLHAELFNQDIFHWSVSRAVRPFFVVGENPVVKKRGGGE